MICRFFECLLPTSICNLECEYCYLIQENRRKMKNISLDYDVKTIKQALTKERLGGICYFSICGTGETLLQQEIVELINALLDNGHYVNITTNGTITKKINQLIELNSELLSHLQVAFSLHYLELKKRNLLNTFFDNVNKVRKSGASIVVQLNLTRCAR